MLGGRQAKHFFVMSTVAFCRSLSENTRLAEIVEAVAALEQAFIKDTGITSEAVG